LTDEQRERFRRRVLAMREEMDALLKQTEDASRPADLAGRNRAGGGSDRRGFRLL